MIKITIEMWPKGLPDNKRLIGDIEIFNDGTGTKLEGNYGVRLMKTPEYAKSKGVWRKGFVKGFNRRRLGPYDLLYLALKACVGLRNK